MAAIMAPPPTSSSPTRNPMTTPNPSASPLPLSASQEAQVRELYHKRVKQKCADEVRDFAACCTNRTFTAPFMCRKPQKAMNNCMLRYATREEMDAARREWFEGIERRKEEKEAKEVKRREDERFWREWWSKEKGVKPGMDKRKEGEGK